MKRTKALLLAAGLGTRLRPLTYQVTKCLVPIAGRPLLDYWIDALLEAQVEEALINTHHLPDQVRAYIDQVNRQGRLHLQETYEPQLLGSAGTLAANPHFADDAEDVLIIYADNFSNVNLRDLLAFHRQHDDPFTMLLFHAPNPKACGIAELDDQRRIIGFQEKPQHPVSDLANAGVYVVNAATYRQMAAMQAFDLGFDVLPNYIGQMRGFIWEGYHRDMGTYQTYLQAQRDAVDLLQQAGQWAGRRPAVFLDRDGTLIEQVHYLSRPDQVKLLPGTGETLQQLRQAGYFCVLVTNQSPIGQGLFTEDDLVIIHQELIRQLAHQGAKLDAFYHCPYATQLRKDRTTVEHYDRKPGPGMLFKAAQDLQIDLTRSWMIGDMTSDILAGYHAHCGGLILVDTGQGLEGQIIPAQVSFHTVPDFPAAGKIILDQVPHS